MANRVQLGECAWTKRLCQEMRACGALVLPYVASRMQPPGYPDRIVVWQGNVYWLEFKGVGTRITDLQFARHEQLRSAGALAFTVRMVAEDSQPVIFWDFDHKGRKVEGKSFDDTGKGLLQALAEITRQ